MKVACPNRRSHSYTQSLIAAPEQVFPLLCPVRELEWVKGWNPSLVLTNSGVAEADCVFVTPKASEETIWIVTRHDPEQFRLEMLMVTPKRTVGKLEIALFEVGDNKTAAEVAYTHTSLGPEGDDFLDGFTEDWYRQFMKDWEAGLNHFLSTGMKLVE
jgi:hypothetical protein